MATYEIRKQNGAGEMIATIDATSVQEAASKHAVSVGVSAQRITGHPTMGGVFQGYVSCDGGRGAMEEMGDPFHVTEA
jgi:hypothetical protein